MLLLLLLRTRRVTNAMRVAQRLAEVAEGGILCLELLQGLGHTSMPRIRGLQVEVRRDSMAYKHSVGELG